MYNGPSLLLMLTLYKSVLCFQGAETSVKELLLGEKTDHFEMGFHMIKGRK